jgi:hypothetical protein
LRTAGAARTSPLEQLAEVALVELGLLLKRLKNRHFTSWKQGA